jgi:uncharacterized membrane protein
LTYALLLFPVLMLFFSTKKQVLHDFLAETVVIDPYYKKTMGIKLIRGFGILAFLLGVLGFMSILYLNIFVYADYNSFTKNYHTEDMNDSRIVFYNKELHRYSKGFIEAKEVYEIFEMDTKQNLALTCIRATLREHNVSNWVSIWHGFSRNARNTYANTAQSIQKAKQNENYMGQHFYEYHLNDVNEIVENIIHVNTGEKNANTCDSLLTVEKMYNRLIRQYIYNRREDLKVHKEAFDKAPASGHLNKAFYHKQIEQGIQWLNLLYAKHPQLKK